MFRALLKLARTSVDEVMDSMILGYVSWAASAASRTHNEADPAAWAE
jgi:hypothetical protein